MEKTGPAGAGVHCRESNMFDPEVYTSKVKRYRKSIQTRSIDVGQFARY